MDTDFLAYREHVCAVYQPFKPVCLDFHFIVDAFEDQMGDNPLDRALLRLHQVHILGPDDNVNGSVAAKAFVHTGELGTQDLHQPVLKHSTFYNITLADKVGYKCVLRLIVDIFRGPHLLDISLVHDHDGV